RLYSCTINRAMTASVSFDVRMPTRSSAGYLTFDEYRFDFRASRNAGSPNSRYANSKIMGRNCGSWRGESPSLDVFQGDSLPLKALSKRRCAKAPQSGTPRESDTPAPTTSVIPPLCARAARRVRAGICFGFVARRVSPSRMRKPKLVAKTDILAQECTASSEG